MLSSVYISLIDQWRHCISHLMTQRGGCIKKQNERKSSALRIFLTTEELHQKVVNIGEKDECQIKEIFV